MGNGQAEVIEAHSEEQPEPCDSVGLREGLLVRSGEAFKVEDLLLRTDGIAERIISRHAYVTGIKDIDERVQTMWPKMLSASRLLLRKLILGSPIIIRFHNDADGMSGAYALYKSIEDSARKVNGLEKSYTAAWIMNRGITYTISDANHDISTASVFRPLDKPLLFIMDFGTSVSSNQGINPIREKFDVIWIDHHPIEEGFAGAELPFYINPWQHGGNSDIPAGFLVSAFSKTLSGIDTREIENASFIGDYSPYADKGAPGADLSALLDMVTSDVRIVSGPSARNITPRELDAIITDKDRYAELLSFAKTRMSDMVASAMSKIKKYKAGACTIYVSDFDDLRGEDTKYPLPGRFSSKLLEELMRISGEHAVLLLNFGPYASIRVDTYLAGKAGILDIIAELKEKYAEEIESGGGHNTAANIKMAQGYQKEDVLHDLIALLKVRLK